MTWFREADGALLVDVRVTPKAGADRVEGVRAAADGTLRLAVKVRAVPDKGAANAAVAALLASHFGVPKTAATVVSCATARLKTVRLAGATPADITAALPSGRAHGQSS